MKTALPGAIPVVLLGVFLFVGCQNTRPQASTAAALRVGSAEIDITPPVGYRMAGYFNERLSTGIHDPLHAKAIVFAARRGSSLRWSPATSSAFR